MTDTMTSQVNQPVASAVATVHLVVTMANIAKSNYIMHSG